MQLLSEAHEHLKYSPNSLCASTGFASMLWIWPVFLFVIGARRPSDLKLCLKISPFYYSTLSPTDLQHSSAAALTSSFSHCSSICFLEWKWNWVISPPPIPLLWAEQVIHGKYFGISGVLVGRRWAQRTAGCTPRRKKNLHLTASRLKSCAFFLVPLGMRQPSAFLPATSLSGGSGVSAWTACRNGSIVLSAPPFKPWGDSHSSQNRGV